MKNITFTLRSVILMCTLLVAASVSAYDFMVDGIYYDLIDSYISEVYDDGGNLKVDGVLFDDGVFVTNGENEYSGAVEIPQTVSYNNKTYRVTGIVSDAFEDCRTLTSITLPNTVTFIGSGAFAGCCSLSKVVFSQYLRYIGECAFLRCESLNRIDLPAYLQTIDELAFCGSGLKSISIPDSVTVQTRAFSHTPIENISVSSTAKLMGLGIFDETPWMMKQPNNEFIYIGTHLYCYNGILPEGSTVAIREGTTGIVGGAFGPYYNQEDYSNTSQGINKVEMPNSVKYIGGWAFTRTHLVKANIPNSVENIGYAAFEGCTDLVSANVPCAVKNLDDYAFSDCTSLRSVTLEEGLETIRECAFSGDEKLNDLIIPNSVRLIDYHAFDNCTSLTKITIGDNTEIIRREAFKGTMLMEITIGSGTKYIGFYSFNGNIGASKVTCLAITPPAIFYYGYDNYKKTNDIIVVTDDDYDCHKTFNTDTYTQATLFVPKGSEEDYKAASPWKDFVHIVGIDTDPEPGDVNGDSEVNISDVNNAVKAILNGETDERFDVNGDGEINIADINAIVKIILGIS